MKIESMRTRSYRSFKVDDADLPAEARERLSAIRRYDELRAAGCAEQAALKVIGVGTGSMLEARLPRLFVWRETVQGKRRAMCISIRFGRAARGDPGQELMQASQPSRTRRT